MTANPVDLHVLELVVAKICHDFAGAVGAIANGVELLSDSGDGGDEEVLKLIAGSARQARRRLQFYRAALGTANSLPEAGPIQAARQIAAELVEESKVTLDWPSFSPREESAVGRDRMKLVLKLLLVALDALPRGGTIQVGLGVDSGRVRATVIARGQAARLPEDAAHALEGTLREDELGPRTVVALTARLSAIAAGGGVTYRATAGEAVELIATWPLSARTSQ